MQRHTACTYNALNVSLVQVPAQNEADFRVELGPDVRTLLTVKPLEGMVYQCHVNLRAECLQLVQRCSKATASNPELLMVIITLAE
jgi:hypothetical protein